MTASHNKYTDNGLKIIDIDGEYFERDIEILYEEFINTKDLTGTLKKIIENLTKEAKSKYFFRDNKSRICIGHDTRRSCDKLLKYIIYALEILGCHYTVYNVITTPQLHWLTYINQINFKNNIFKAYIKEELYWTWITAGYEIFNELCEKYSIKLNEASNYEREILVDCSYGITAVKVENIRKVFEKRKNLKLDVKYNNIYT